MQTLELGLRSIWRSHVEHVEISGLILNSIPESRSRRDTYSQVEASLDGRVNLGPSSPPVAAAFGSRRADRPGRFTERGPRGAFPTCG